MIDEILNKYAPGLTDREHIKLRDALLKAIKAAKPEIPSNQALALHRGWIDEEGEAAREYTDKYEEELLKLFGLEG